MNYINLLIIIGTITLIIFVAIPIIVVFIECLAAAVLDNPSDDTPNSSSKIPSFTVMVPAHNEASHIRITLDSIINEINHIKQIIVIADNCDDRTADLARETGVTVIERHNSEQRGKGYAMEYGFSYLSSQPNPPEVVVMVDGDCVVAENTIQTLAYQAWFHQKPVQGNYLMEVPPFPKTIDVISCFAVIVKNSVRQLGLAKLGLPCLLTGSGIAVPWQAIPKVSLGNSKTTDDMQLGIDLAIAGYSPIHSHSVKITGRLMESQFAQSQRSRWEHGHLDTLFSQVPVLLREAITQKRVDLLVLALELAVPPLSLLVFFSISLTLLTLIEGLFLGTWSLLGIQLMIGILLICAILIAFLKFGKEKISIRELAKIPFYLLWKIPLYLVFLVRPQNKWIKTERDIK